MKMLITITRVVREHPLKLAGILIASFLLGGAVSKDEDGLFGQTSAAWVQAIGSVAAIVAAIWISRDDRNSDRRDSIRREAQAALVVLAEILGFLRSFPESISNENDDSIRQYFRDEAKEYLQIIRTFRFEDIPPDIFHPARLAATSGLNHVVGWSLFVSPESGFVSAVQEYSADLERNIAAIRTAASGRS